MDLPAPFRPMTPTTSPWAISNETSRSAQKSSRLGGLTARPISRRNGDATVDASTSRKATYELALGLMADAVPLPQALNGNN